MNNFKKIAANVAAEKYNSLREVEQFDEKVMVFHSTSPGADMKRFPKDSSVPGAKAHRDATATAVKGLRKAGEMNRKSLSYGSTGDMKTSKGGTVNAMRVKEDAEVDTVEEMSDSQMKKREDTVKSMKKNYSDFRKRYGEKAKSVMYATATKMAKEDVNQDETEDKDQHLCAKHVYSNVHGEGVVLDGMHAEPDENGNIEWYGVEFSDGPRKVFTEKLEVMVAEYHMNHKKKKKMMEEDEELDEMSSRMKMKLGLYGKKKKMMKEDDLEEQEGGIPKTAAHKKLAGHYGDPSKITRGDIITAAKKTAKAKGM